MTKGQMREIARELFVATSKAIKANCPEAMPGDDWLDIRLRQCGCQEEELEAARANIKDMPLRDIADGGGC